MRQPHEGLEALFDVRHDHELVDDGVRRLGRDDAGLRDADVAARRRCAAWHGRWWRPSSGPSSRPVRSRCRRRGRAGRARSRPSWCTGIPRVLIEWPPQQTTRLGLDLQSSTRALRRMWNTALVMAAGLFEVETAALDDLVGDEDHVAQHREQVLLDAADHLAVDERLPRRVLDLELDAPGLRTSSIRNRCSARRFPWRCRFRCRSSAPPARTCGTAGKGRRLANPAACRSRPGTGSRGCRAVRRAHPRSRE